MSVTILQGDCREMLQTLPAASAQCCVTSPPYFGLRDYGVDGQLEIELNPDYAEIARRRIAQDQGGLFEAVE